MIRCAYTPRSMADLGKHVMPIRKFGMVAAAIEAAGLPIRIIEPGRASDADILRVHTPEYLRAIDTGAPPELATSQKFPWSRELAEAVRWTNGGCISALRWALEDGIAGNLASGFHHSHADHGQGYCTFNGLVIAYEALRAEGRAIRPLVVDMDLHYGNGTASLLSTRPEMFQLSIYGNWYYKNVGYRDVTSRRDPDTENAWSIPVLNGSGREEYLGILKESLPRAIEKARPNVVLFQAGADPYKEDPYSPLDLDHEALKARDLMVFEACKRAGIPVMWVLAGGYTTDTSKVVEVHLNTARAAVEVFGARLTE